MVNLKKLQNTVKILGAWVKLQIGYRIDLLVLGRAEANSLYRAEYRNLEEEAAELFPVR